MSTEEPVADDGSGSDEPPPSTPAGESASDVDIGWWTGYSIGATAVGAALLIVSVWLFIASALAVLGETGSGWQGPVLGGIGIAAASALFVTGRRLTRGGPKL